MNEFEKWKDERGADASWFEGAEEGWKAALEWALKAGKNGNCGWCYTEAVIEEELSGNQTDDGSD